MQDILRTYGADVDGAMQRMMYDEEFYLECIKSYLEDKAFIGLKQSLDKQDFKAAFEHAHTLKGVAANLGLTPIYRAICNITEPLRHQETADYDGLYHCIDQQKNKLAGIMTTIKLV